MTVKKTRKKKIPDQFINQAVQTTMMIDSVRLTAYGDAVSPLLETEVAGVNLGQTLIGSYAEFYRDNELEIPSWLTALGLTGYAVLAPLGDEKARENLKKSPLGKMFKKTKKPKKVSKTKK